MQRLGGLPNYFFKHTFKYLVCGWPREMEEKDFIARNSNASLDKKAVSGSMIFELEK